MLVLSRKLGEQVVVNDNIVITVIEIERGKIKIGFDAPSTVPILRKELYDRFREPTADEPR